MIALNDKATQEAHAIGLAQDFHHRVKRLGRTACTDELGLHIHGYRSRYRHAAQHIHGRKQRYINQPQRDAAMDATG